MPAAAHAHGMCLNCGTALIGDYCHACGQAEHVHRSLASIGHDLLHGVFHFEGKIWRTLPMLATHPGALTRRYIAGERARFVSPLALFLFSVFLMFATIHTFDGELQPTETQQARTNARSRSRRSTRNSSRPAIELKEAEANHATRDQSIPDGDLIAAQAVASSLTDDARDPGCSARTPMSEAS